MIFPIIAISINLRENEYHTGERPGLDGWTPFSGTRFCGIEWRGLRSARVQSRVVFVSLGNPITPILTLTEVLCFVP